MTGTRVTSQPEAENTLRSGGPETVSGELAVVLSPAASRLTPTPASHISNAPSADRRRPRAAIVLGYN